MSGQIQDMVKPFVSVKWWNKHRAKITLYTVAKGNTATFNIPGVLNML